MKRTGSSYWGMDVYKMQLFAWFRVSWDFLNLEGSVAYLLSWCCHAIMLTYQLQIDFHAIITYITEYYDCSKQHIRHYSLENIFNLVVTQCKLHNVHVRAIQSLAVPKSNAVKIMMLFKGRHFLFSSNWAAPSMCEVWDQEINTMEVQRQNLPPCCWGISPTTCPLINWI